MRLLPNGIKIGNATVIVDIISKKNPKIRPGLPMKPTHITDHDTGNPARGANAEMHNRYIHNMSSYDPKDTGHVSWHVTVDQNFIYQHIPFDENGWHCGDGSGTKSGNRTSIGVEKTMNVDGNRARVEENAIALHAYLLKAFKLTPNRVVPHQHWNGKYCPAVILKRDGSFNPYRKRIQDAFSGASNKPVSKPVTSNLHTVKRGDTLSAIAVKYKTSVAKIQSDNNIKHANFIYPGQVLKVGGSTTSVKVASKPTPKPKTTKQTVTLPKTAKTWRTYKTNVQPVKKNSDWSLTPSAFGGLTYDIIGRPYTDVVTIKTSKGNRNIYVGKGTGAIIK
jgi:N-acetylmuramoyl-L-alanine amidase CwlA